MAKKTIKAQMKQRRDTKANWEATNPVLLDGELGIVSDDPNLYKVGDGATAWNSLPFRGFDGTLAQELGTSPNAVISQKVVSEKLTELESEVGKMNSYELFTVGTIKYLVQYASPLTIDNDTTIKVIPSTNSDISGVSIVVIRDGSTKYLAFFNGGEYFYFPAKANDKITSIYTNGGEDGEVCKVQYVSEDGVAKKIEVIENSYLQQSQILADINADIKVLEANMSAISEEVGIYTTFTSGTIRYIVQYSPYREIQKDTTLQVTTPTSSSISGVSVTVARGGSDKYLPTFKNGNIYTISLLAGDVIKFIYVNGGEDGEVCKVKFMDAQDIVERLQTSAFREGKQWMAIGDSLTSIGTLGEGVDNYVTLVANRLGLTAINKGIGGTGYWKQKIANEAFFQRIPTYTESADIITIFGSFNDLGSQDGVNGKGIIGSATDSGTDTICGCMNATFDAIEQKYPNAIVGIITPTPWSNSHDDNYAEQYVERLKEIAAYRSIPCLDLYHRSNLRPWDESFRATFYKSATDGAHPNTLGHQRIGGMIADFIHSILF